MREFLYTASIVDALRTDSHMSRVSTANSTSNFTFIIFSGCMSATFCYVLQVKVKLEVQYTVETLDIQYCS